MFNNRPAIERKYRPRQNQTADDSSDFFDSIEGGREILFSIRDSIQQRMLSEYEDDLSPDQSPQYQEIIESLFNQYLEEKNLLYTRTVRNRVLDWVIADILSYGPLEPLLNDPEITEIMVNGYKDVYIERFGKIEKTSIVFEDDKHLRRIIERIVAPIGRRVDEASPMVDARLPSGYRVNATIAPLSLDGSILTIRKFAETPYTAQDLILNGTFSSQLVNFLRACVMARINIIISGGTGTGKTTLLNVISAFIPTNERIITIEDTAELQLHQEHVIRLEKRPPNVEGKGEITIRQLVINALRMRPDRIIVGEARGGEALDMLQAMNTGHDGSMTTIHSNSPRDTLRRIETMVLMAGMDLPLKAIREQAASSIDLIVHLDRMRDGTRKVVQVSEVQGLEGDTIVMQDLFKFVSKGFENGRILGSLKSTGLRPSFLEKIDLDSIALPADTFVIDPDPVD
jgi:pilus assembly protein CpaF